MTVMSKAGSDSELDLVSDTKRKRNELSNARKMEVIQLAQEGRSQRQLAAEFGVSKSQVQSILQRKDDIIYRQQNEGDDAMPPRKKTNFDDVNERVLDWYVQAKARGVTVTGAYLQQKAREIGRELGKDYFRGSNGWLEAFKKRHKGLFAEGKVSSTSTISKEPPSKSPSPVREKPLAGAQSFQVTNITEGFHPRDVYFACETSLQYRSLPDLFVTNGDRYLDMKMGDRLTVLLCTNMLGRKESVFVVGRHGKHPLFRNMESKNLPVDWITHMKALMSGDHFLSWLRKFNDRLRKQDRRILLFLESTPVHVDVKLSNIVLRFFRETETSKVHVLHTGLTQEFKLQYRTRILRYYMARGVALQSHEAVNAEVYEKIDLIHGLYWINASWELVKARLIQESFSAAGFPAVKDRVNVHVSSPSVSTQLFFSGFSEPNSPLMSPNDRQADNSASKDDYMQAFAAICQLPDAVEMHDAALRYLSADDALPTYDAAENTWEESSFASRRLPEASRGDLGDVYENGKETVHLCLLNSFEEVDETLRQLQDYGQESNSATFLSHIMQARDCLVDDIWRKQYPLEHIPAKSTHHDQLWRSEPPCHAVSMDYVLERASFAVSPPSESKIIPAFESSDSIIDNHSNDNR